MTKPVSIVVICGSLRKGSANAASMRAALADPPDGVELVPHDVSDVPFYDGDVEEAGIPEPVERLLTAVETADGLCFFTPEYNSSFPAVTKNAIDWLSRPPRSWEGTGITLVVTTPGGRAGQGIRAHFETVTDFLPVRAFAAHGIGKYPEKIVDGELADEDAKRELREFMASFAAHCAAGE